jgi:hypothetical protein
VHEFFYQKIVLCGDNIDAHASLGPICLFVICELSFQRTFTEYNYSFIVTIRKLVKKHRTNHFMVMKMKMMMMMMKMIVKNKRKRKRQKRRTHWTQIIGCS